MSSNDGSTLDDRLAGNLQRLDDDERFARLQSLRVNGEVSALEVLALCDELEATATDVCDGSGLALLLARASEAQRMLGMIDEARDLALRSCEISRRMEDRAGEQRALYQLGQARVRAGEMDLAREAFELSLEAAESGFDVRSIARCRIELSYVLAVLGRIDLSEREALMALSASRETGSQRDIAKAAGRLSQVLNSRGDRSGAETYLETALHAYEAVADVAGKVWVLGQIGESRISSGEYAHALDALFEAMSLAEEIGNPSSIVSCLSSIATVCRDLNDYEGSIAYAQKALDIAAVRQDRMIIAKLKGTIGAAHVSLGRYTEAREYLEQAMSIAQSTGQRAQAAYLLGLLAWLQLDCGEFAAAKEGFEAAAKAANESGFNSGGGAFHAAIGRTLGHPVNPDRDVDGAIRYLHEGLLLMGDSDKMYASANHEMLGRLYGEKGDRERAHYHLGRHRTLHHELHSHEAHVSVLALQHQHTMAKLEAQRAVERAEIEAARLRAELLERELEHKQHQLASSAMSLARQTELLGRFRNDLRAIMRGNSDLLEIVKQIREKLQELPCEAIDWTKFEAEFQQTYPEFQSKLVANCPELTKMEVKICSLLRVNLTSLEVAQLMCKSERSIEWHRLNIRRKLALTREQDVYAALAMIE